MKVDEIVIRVNVSDLKKSVMWYTDKLGFEFVDTPFPMWARLKITGISNTIIGLEQQKVFVVKGEQEVTTFVVSNIIQTRNDLLNKGVNAGPIQDIGYGTSLVFFKDLDGNNFALRQNN